MYTRVNDRVFFLLPTIAIGLDIDDSYFVEIAWGNYVLGFGNHS